jgi:hypothetical protein
MVLRDVRGQASVELVAVLPLVAVIALALWQVVVAGQAAWLAGAAARAAARAAAVGADPQRAGRRALPGSLASGLRVTAGRDGSVTVRMAVPLVVGHGSLTSFREQARFAPQR